MAKNNPFTLTANYNFKPYHEFQFAWWILIVIPVWMLLAFSHYFGYAENSLDQLEFYLLSGFLLLLFLMFYGMKTCVYDSEIKLIFGIGLIRKTILLTDVKSVETVRNKWYYGWGIRIIPHGWLYNVAGLRSVEIQRKTRQAIVRIGSRHPEVLRSIILERI